MSKLVTIDCPTEGADILYSTDGTSPTLPYNGSITLTDAGEYTITAIAKKEAYLDSEEVTQNTSVNYYVGDTIGLDGIECLIIATNITIQGSEHNAIAIDKNYDLGYYINYVGQMQDGYEITEQTRWRWGAYGIEIGGTRWEVGYGLQNTNICLSNDDAFTVGTSTYSGYASYPLIWQGVKDFRETYGDNWFVPSQYELINYVYPNSGSLSFDSSTGAEGSSNYFWSSSESDNSIYSRRVALSSGSSDSLLKYWISSVRLCRAFTNATS